MRHVSGHRRRQGRRAPRGAGNRFLGRPLSFETDPTEKRQTSLADRPSGRRRSLQQRPRKLPRVVTRDRSRASPPSSAAVGGGVSHAPRNALGTGSKVVLSGGEAYQQQQLDRARINDQR